VHIGLGTEAILLVEPTIAVGGVLLDPVEDVETRSLLATAMCIGCGQIPSIVAAAGEDYAATIVHRWIAFAEEIAPGHNLGEVQLTPDGAAKRGQRHGGWRNSAREG